MVQGACTFIEQSLGREVAWVACRHHILELLLAIVFHALFGPAGGPDVSLFKRFQQAWSFVDQTKFYVACNNMVDAYTSVVQTQMVKYYTTALPESHPREDYKELIQHTYIHPFNGPLSGTTRVSRYQKGKTNLDFTEARGSE